MSSLLDKRNTIYGACSIWIMLFHVFRRISMPYIPVVTNIISIGNMAVDIFFFFSGLCLSLSVPKHNYQEKGWEEYYKRRLLRILLPYLIICIPFYFWTAIFETSGGIVRRCLVFFANITSASFWLKGTQTTWYVYGILLFYALFPAIYTFVKKGKIGKWVVLLLGMILLAIVASYTPVVKKSIIVWARLPVFSIGIIAGVTHEKSTAPNNNQTVVAFIITVFLGWLTSFSELSETISIPSVYKFMLFIPLLLALMSLLSRYGKKSKFLSWVGGLSLEVYLVHITLLHPLNYYGAIQMLGNWLYICLPAVTLLLVWCIEKVEKQILKQGGRS